MRIKNTEYSTYYQCISLCTKWHRKFSFFKFKEICSTSRQKDPFHDIIFTSSWNLQGFIYFQSKHYCTLLSCCLIIILQDNCPGATSSITTTSTSATATATATVTLTTNCLTCNICSMCVFTDLNLAYSTVDNKRDQGLILAYIFLNNYSLTTLYSATSGKINES